MKIGENLSWRVKLGIILVFTSIVLYIALYWTFHDPHQELFLLGIDLAFVPLEVLFVVLVIETAIGEREKRIMMEKMNMVIGTFFSEVGAELLTRITNYDPDTDKIRHSLLVNANWSAADYKRAIGDIEKFDYTLKITGRDANSWSFWCQPRSSVQNRKFLLGLMENPNLLEHETFTDLCAPSSTSPRSWKAGQI